MNTGNLLSGSGLVGCFDDWVQIDDQGPEGFFAGRLVQKQENEGGFARKNEYRVEGVAELDLSDVSVVLWTPQHIESYDLAPTNPVKKAYLDNFLSKESLMRDFSVAAVAAVSEPSGLLKDSPYAFGDSIVTEDLSLFMPTISESLPVPNSVDSSEESSSGPSSLDFGTPSSEEEVVFEDFKLPTDIDSRGSTLGYVCDSSGYCVIKTGGSSDLFWDY